MPSLTRNVSPPDVAIVGSGPNGLTAGVLLARAGLRVQIFEASQTPGGGCRSAALTLPGFVHDVCSAVHPMGALSPVFNDIGLTERGLTWLPSQIPLAHPLPDGRVAVLERSLAATAERLGSDGRRWAQLLSPFSHADFIQSLLRPVWYPGRGSLLAKARFGLVALRSCEQVARRYFQDEPARAIFAGCAAHSTMALDRAGTASFGLVLAAVGHAIDWPCARGGSQSITSAASCAICRGLRSKRMARAGGSCCKVTMRCPSESIPPDASKTRTSGHELPARYRDRLARFRHGAGVFKIDWALSQPIPWKNPECRSATTVHVCGEFEEILRSEGDVSRGQAPEKPFVLVAQPSLIDPTRAPAGRHTGWAYCHVPNGCTIDMTDRIENQIERFAPGFRECILARHTIDPAQLEAHNPAMIGGDIAGGENSLSQFLFRPAPRLNPYTTPNPRLFICSSSTPPGGGVHGMCGYHAARAVMKRLRVPKK